MSAPRFERDEITRLAYWMAGLWGFLLYAIGPALPALRRELDVSRAAVGLHTTVIAAGAIAVGLVGEAVVVRLGRRRVFWLAGAGLAAGSGSLALGHHVAVTLPAAALFGFAGAFAIVLVQATLADRHGALAAAALVEANAVAVCLGVAAPIAISLAIVAGGSWRAVFLLAAVVPVPLLALAYRGTVFPEAPLLDHEEVPKLPARYWWHWLALLTFVATEFSIFLWATDYLETERGLSAAAASALTGSFVIGMAVGRLCGGVLARRFEPSRLLGVAIATASLGFCGFWLADVPAVSVAGLGVAGLGVSLLYPLTLALALRSAPGRTDAASARASFANGIAVAVAPFVLAALADRIGLAAAYTVVPVLLGAGSLALAGAARAVTPRAASSPTRDPEPADA